MANPEHVALVRKGAEAIARWRERHVDEQLNLAGADLSNIELAGADLSDALLVNANLAGSDLRGTDFTRSNLCWADLSEADAKGANFRLANLFQAYLMHADLSGAYLTGANVNEAFLFLADMSTVWLDSTSFGKVDFTGVRGIDLVVHHTDSTIGVDTLIASFRGAGNKPTLEMAAFFRGAGVPQELLNTLPAIVATALYEDLRARGVSCWLYELDKTVGKPTWEIEERLGEFVR